MAHAILVSTVSRPRLLWFLDDELEGVEEFHALSDARQWAEELRLLLTIGVKGHLAAALTESRQPGDLE